MKKKITYSRYKTEYDSDKRDIYKRFEGYQPDGSYFLLSEKSSLARFMRIIEWLELQRKEKERRIFKFKKVKK